MQIDQLILQQKNTKSPSLYAQLEEEIKKSSTRLIVDEKMADDRVSRKTAEGVVPIAPHTWYVRKINWITTEQPAVKEPYNTSTLE